MGRFEPHNPGNAAGTARCCAGGTRRHVKRFLFARPARAQAAVAGLLCALGLGLVPAATRAKSGDVSALARRLATLRGEIEELSAQLGSKKDAYRAQLRSLAEQKADLEVQLRREGLRLEQLKSAKVRQQESLGDQGTLGEALRPVLLDGIHELKKIIRTGLPFRVAERIGDLQKLETQITSGLLKPQDAAYQLWQTYEDELRLTRESGLYRQTIELDGRETLADVARIGMVSLYFHTHDQRYGQAERKGGKWNYTTVESRPARKQLAQLFDSFKKQVRVGFFTVPNALAKAGQP